MNRILCRCAIALTLGASGLSLAAAPDGERYETRLASLPMDMISRDLVAGSGRATATLSGSTLNVSASFEGLPSNATAAHVHEGVATGGRGLVIANLTVPSAASGTATGTVKLSSKQLAALRAGRLYVQIDSEKAPKGNLWGWLLKAAPGASE